MDVYHYDVNPIPFFTTITDGEYFYKETTALFIPDDSFRIFDKNHMLVFLAQREGLKFVTDTGIESYYVSFVDQFMKDGELV